MATNVFISYRREDSRYQARLIYEAFQTVLGRDSVFMDIDSIAPGADFRRILKSWVDACDILLALVGPRWIDAVDHTTGERRLDNANDFVRIEIAEGLARGIPVVPVLLDGTPMPPGNSLPADLRGLADRQAEFVEFRTFNVDVQRLIVRLGLSQRAGAPTPSVGELPSDGDSQRVTQEVPYETLALRSEGEAPIATVASVLAASQTRPVVVAFSAEWQHHHKQFMVLVDRLAEHFHSRVHFLRVNVDLYPELTNYAKVEEVPWVCAVRSGKMMDSIRGLQREGKYRALVDRILSLP